MIETDISSEVVEKRGPYTHYGPGNVSHCIDGLAKNNSYSVMVQVESIAGNQESERMYLGTRSRRGTTINCNNNTLCINLIKIRVL